MQNHTSHCVYPAYQHFNRQFRTVYFFYLSLAISLNSLQLNSKLLTVYGILGASLYANHKLCEGAFDVLDIYQHTHANMKKSCVYACLINPVEFVCLSPITHGFTEILINEAHFKV